MKICYVRLLSCVLFFILLFLQKSAFGQGNFLSGYIISTKNDTTKGFIRNAGWDESPLYLEFRQNNEKDIERLDAKYIAGFHIPSLNLNYKSRKIAIININLSAVYDSPPSLQAKDSVIILLREITSGPNISLLEYRDELLSHYYLEKKGKLTELVNYPFYRLIGEKTYLQTYDQYKKQLPELLSDAPDFTAQIPAYTQKELRKYIDRYIVAINGVNSFTQSQDDDDVTIDLNFNGGTEEWREPEVLLKPKITFGFGLRLNLPRKFHNRYVKLNMSLIPGVAYSEIYDQSYQSLTDKITLKTIELGIGTYMGSRKIKPFIGMDYAFPMSNWRSSILSPHAGIGFKRKFSLEVSHFANFNTLFTPTPFFSKPRITFNYYLDLNNLFNKK